MPNKTRAIKPTVGDPFGVLTKPSYWECEAWNWRWMALALLIAVLCLLAVLGVVLF